MAQATCENENCDRGTWELTKPPASYKNGVSCPDCGTTRVDVQMDQQDRQPAGQGGQGQQLPQQQQGGQQPGAMAPAQGGGGGGIQSLLAAIDGDVPAEARAQGLQRAGGILGNVARQLYQYQQSKKQMREQRAQEVSLQESNLPECEKEMTDGEPCGYQFGPEDIGMGDRVRCPRCETVYDIAEP